MAAVVNAARNSSFNRDMRFPSEIAGICYSVRLFSKLFELSCLLSIILSIILCAISARARTPAICRLKVSPTVDDRDWKMAELLLLHGTIVTVDTTRRVIENAALAVSDDRIVDIYCGGGRHAI